MVRHFRIRPCSGNRDAWLLVAIHNGKESDCCASYTTALSLDSLLERAGHLTPRPGDIVEFIPRSVKEI